VAKEKNVKTDSNGLLAQNRVIAGSISYHSMQNFGHFQDLSTTEFRKVIIMCACTSIHLIGWAFGTSPMVFGVTV